MKTITFKITFILLILITKSIVFSQYKVIYEMKWKSQRGDSIYKKELCALAVNTDKIYFQSLENFKRDSLQTAIVKDYFKNQKGNLRLPDDKTDAKFSTLIIKDKTGKSYSVEEKIFSNVYITSCNNDIHWKLLPDQVPSIFGYKVNKAIATFGGRNWTAFYTTEVSLPFGPYKFDGLPGLILKIEDDKKEYIFEIKGITKETSNLEERNFSYNSIVLNHQKWVSFWSKYKNQPSMIFENLNTEETTFVLDGQDVSNKEVKASYDKREKERLAFFDNPIELKSECK